MERALQARAIRRAISPRFAIRMRRNMSGRVYHSAEEVLMPTPRLSDRARRMPASPIRRLAPYAVAARAAGKTVYSLNIGQPDIPTPKEVLDRLRTYPGANVPYGPSQGLPEFLEALSTY